MKEANNNMGHEITDDGSNQVTVHLDNNGRPLCGRGRKFQMRTGELASVTCERCLTRYRCNTTQKPLRPWQKYLLSQCPQDSIRSMPESSRIQSSQWRFANWEAFHYDVVKCYGPVAATSLSMAYRPETIVEMGVFSGHTSFILCRCNPDARIHGVDIASQMPGTTLPTAYTALLHGVDNFTLHIGESSEFKMKDVDMCFIDADHTGEKPYLDTLRAWENRNVKGEWCIAWDDYHENNPDVARAVNRFVKEVGMELHKLMSWFYIGTKPHSAVEAFL